jgi:hypothetical protein
MISLSKYCTRVCSIRLHDVQKFMVSEFAMLKAQLIPVQAAAPFKI